MLKQIQSSASQRVADNFRQREWRYLMAKARLMIVTGRLGLAVSLNIASCKAPIAG